jgi:hypothetical protein
MNRAYALIQAAFVAIPLPAQQVFAQGMKDGIGTWTAVSNETTLADGKKIQPFGSKPVHILTFDPEGRYALQLCSPDRPKFSSNNRVQGTPRRVQSCGPWLQSALGPVFG